MGKTTLWSAGIAHAQEQGVSVLAARPAESEITLSFCALGDVLHPVLEESLAPLPDGQRHALSCALLLDEAEGPPPDPHAVGVAVLNGLRGLGERRPLLIAVDDVQWLDPASAGALQYAVRRLRDERIGVLLARRTGAESLLLEEVARCLPAGRVQRIEVGPLGVAELGGVLQQQVGGALPRPLLAEVREASGGNPFYALEIVRMLKRTGVSVEAGHPLPVPEALHDLVHSRLLALPPESRDYLLAAAAHSHPTTSVVEAATGVERRRGLTPALEARIVELDGSRIAFTHPLLAAGAYEIADPIRRSEIHARLAELLEDPEARAWQLAASVDEPDEDVASVLEEAAAHARARGAPRLAALLLDRAAEMTPTDRPSERSRRFAAAAGLHFDAGDSRRAESRLADLIGALAGGRDRARVLTALARIRTYAAPDEAGALYHQALDEAEEDPELLALAHEGVASSCVWLMQGLDEAVRHAQTTYDLAQEIGDDALRADAVLAKLWAEAALGREAAGATAELALTLEEVALDRRLLDQPSVALAEYWMWIDSPDRALALVSEMLDRAQVLGDEASRPYLLMLRGLGERLVGRLERALMSARDGLTAANQAGQPLLAGFNLAVESVVLSELGRRDELRSATRLALELAPRNGYVGLLVASARGHLELSVDAPGAAVTHLEPAVEVVRREGVVEPGLTRFVVDQIEALTGVARLGEAVELLDWFEGHARRLERLSALASCARCRGLLAAQAGDTEDALAAFEEALALHEHVDIPLDRGRTLLTLGAAQRRAKRRRDARATLEAALGVFERIGAALWAERARSELKRISGRAPTPGALTPAEEKVAALVAEGKTNREVAAALVLGERTVETHLTHVYAKLGIRSRTELARVFEPVS
jgi:DNA-binding CsgD family transcriptional regulator